MRHFGAPLEAELAAEAFALQSHERRYRYHGAQPHGLVRAAIKAAHVLVHPSLMEGGANVASHLKNLVLVFWPILFTAALYVKLHVPPAIGILFAGFVVRQRRKQYAWTPGAGSPC